MAKSIKKYVQPNNVVIDPPKGNTIIRHKRGNYNEDIVSRLKDGELFYDTTGRHGIYMGVYNDLTKTNDIVKIAEPADGSGPSQYIKKAVKSDDNKTLTLTDQDNTQIAFTPDVPSTYVKDANVSGDTLTLTKQDDSQVSFSKPDDYVKTVNNVQPDANKNVNVRTFSDIPEVMSPYMGGTTAEFCDKLTELVDPAGGTAYLTGAYFTDAPLSIQGGNFELYVYVPVNGVYVLEVSSCDSFETLGGGIAGKWMAIYQGSSAVMDWHGVMACPQKQVGNEKLYIPVNNSDGISFAYLKKFAEANNLTIPEI